MLARRRDRALRLYLSRNKKPSEMIARLSAWNDDKTIDDNASTLGISVYTAKAMRYKYGLACGMRGRSLGMGKLEPYKDKIIELIGAGLTYREVGETYGASPQGIWRLVHRRRDT